MGRKLGPFQTINGATARLGPVASSAFRQTQKAGEPLPEIVSVPLTPKGNTALTLTLATLTFNHYHMFIFIP